MITFQDLVQQEQFRDYVCQRLVEHTDDRSYSFCGPFPSLYKYRGLSEYAVNDIINSKFTLTAIGDFNDLFDGAMHRYGTEDERIAIAEQEWEKFEKIIIAAGLPDGLLSHDNVVNNRINHYKVDSRLEFRKLDLLGTYIGSLSTENSSILMWSHYAKNNSGICIEYDFNKLPSDLPSNCPLRDMIFPVSYSCKTIDLSDLLDDKKKERYQYPLDAAVLCAALSKANIWDYEHEWRIVFVDVFDKIKDHKQIDMFTLPQSICFGYHFLKPMFYYDYNDAEKLKYATKKAAEQIEHFIRLIDYMADHGICAKMMVPVVGTYGLKPEPIDVEELKRFVTYHFRNKKPERIHLYYSIHDELMDIVERK